MKSTILLFTAITIVVMDIQANAIRKPQLGMTGRSLSSRSMRKAPEKKSDTAEHRVRSIQLEDRKIDQETQDSSNDEVGDGNRPEIDRARSREGDGGDRVKRNEDGDRRDKVKGRDGEKTERERGQDKEEREKEQGHDGERREGGRARGRKERESGRDDDRRKGGRGERGKRDRSDKAS